MVMRKTTIVRLKNSVQFSSKRYTTIRGGGRKYISESQWDHIRKWFGETSLYNRIPNWNINFIS